MWTKVKEYIPPVFLIGCCLLIIGSVVAQDITPLPDPAAVEATDITGPPNRVARMVEVDQPDPTRARLMKAAEARGQSLDEFLEWLDGALDNLDGDKPTPPDPVVPDPVPDPVGVLAIKVQPASQEVGKPVAVMITGTPEGKHYEKFDWSPSHPEDFKLDLYDRNGRPVTIFWSTVPGTRTIQMVTGVNGPEVPIIQFVKVAFTYGPEPHPPGPSPAPIPAIVPPAEPTDATLRAIVTPIAAMLKDDARAGLSMAGFYMAVADATRRDSNIAKTSDLRAFLSLAEEDAYLDTKFVGKYPGFGKLVNEGYDRYIGLEDEPLDAPRRVKSAAFFTAVAWACFPQPVQ